MQLSVILSTYNSPRWLEKVLWGYSHQSYRDFNIVVADDGSGPETAALIDRMREQTGLKLTHVWQEDDGFRKCRILNKAVLEVERQAQSPYVLFSDGDCIPRGDFLAVHAAAARPGEFLSGSYYKLPLALSEAITPDDIAKGRCFDTHWLHAHGLPRTRKTLKLRATPAQARWLNRLTPVRCRFKGSNASVWLEDILRVNGFDERMPWGGEDREFGARLNNAGIRGQLLWYSAICVHLDHARGYVDSARVASNKALRQQNEREGVYWTVHGIDQLR